MSRSKKRKLMLTDFKQETETKKVDFVTELAARDLQFTIDTMLRHLQRERSFSIPSLANVSRSWNHIMANSKLKT